MHRRQNFQTIAWFHDLNTRARLDLDPPYQRRSVWTQAFKDYFIDTILLNYPAPAIFLYEDMRPDGVACYHVVDGKQRLTSIFEFVNDEFAVSENAQRQELRGKYWSALDDDTKRQFWGYQFSVEYLPSVDETAVSSIFDRINRNTARLKAQELRHAKFGGVFIREVESLSEWLFKLLPPGFPNIAPSSRKQMKDVELVAELLLLLEEGPKGHSTEALDAEFAKRDEQWDERTRVEDEFRDAAKILHKIATTDGGETVRSSRLRNQSDFYSLFGAIAQLRRAEWKPDIEATIQTLREFSSAVESEDDRLRDKALKNYYEAARSASNDTGPRETRIAIVASVLSKAAS